MFTKDILIEQNPSRKLQESLFLANMPADSDDSFLNSSQRETRGNRERAVSPREPPGGAPESPAAKAMEDPCDPLARACLLHLKTVLFWLCPSRTIPFLPLLPPCREEAQRDISPGQARRQVLRQRRKWWCRGPALVGEQVSSEQTVREAKKEEIS